MPTSDSILPFFVRKCHDSYRCYVRGIKFSAIMSVKSTSIVGDANGVVRTGYLKKLKTYKKKFFVLRADTKDSAARLEYYDSEKKFLAEQPPKRTITLKSCFNINKHGDGKHKHVIALYTKDDRFCLVFDNDDELESWLRILLSLQQGDEIADGVPPRPTFEHVWQVTLLKRGLGNNYCKESGTAVYRLCLTDKILSLITKDSLEVTIELTLSSIRSCGNLKGYFFLELGRSSSIGAGELWMETEDANIAQNVHYTVYHAMAEDKNKNHELEPKCRNRSSSATESSKPGNSIHHPALLSGCKAPFQQDTLPTSQEEAPVQATPGQSTVVFVITYRDADDRERVRICSCHTGGLFCRTAGGTLWPATVNHQRTRSLPVAQPATTDQIIQPHRTAKSINQSKCFTGSAGRERCDSMPSRPRTTSEGAHNNGCYRTCLQRPQSFYNREFSLSGSPKTPPSAAGSTDSAGSSTSIDECTHDDMQRCGYTHSLTPDEPIAEEDIIDDLYCGDRIKCSQRIRLNSEEGYVNMSGPIRNVTSPTTSQSSITSGTPSNDCRFQEYNLEKPFPCIFKTDDDDLRHERTKSVGSRPETKYQNHLQSARERAFSCGAKTKRMGPERIFVAHHPTPKSSSAPLLPASMDPSSDLMLLDFSTASKTPSGYMSMTPGSKTSSSSGYVPMKPGVIPDVNHNHDRHRQRSHQSTESSRSNRGIIKGHEIRSNPDTNKNKDYVDMRPGTSPKVQPTIPEVATSNSYMMMSLGKNKKDKKDSPRSRSPISPSTSSGDYMDMNYNRNKAYNFEAASISPVKSSISPNMFEGSPSSIEYIDVDPKEVSTEGYVEMTPGVGISHQRQSSIESNDAEGGDYANMSFQIRERKNSKKERRSQPIQIQSNQSKTSGTSPSYYHWGGVGEPQAMALPISSHSNTSSLPRQQRSRNNSRRESRDSSSSSVTTPSSCSTMLFPFSLNSPSSPTPSTPQESDYLRMDYTPKSKEGDYTVMTPGAKKENEMCFRPIMDNTILRSDSIAEESPKSRPGSTSSEVGSTTSTLVNSRPPSVNSDRPRSGSEGLLYAKLKLTTEEDGNRSPRTVKPEGDKPVETAFGYAKIDFIKSDGFKHSQPILSNTKVKH